MERRTSSKLGKKYDKAVYCHPACWICRQSTWREMPGWMNSKLESRFSSVQFSSVAQSCPTLRPHESQHTRPPCPSPTPGVHSDSRPSGQWCHPAISSSVVPFSSCPQSLPGRKINNLRYSDDPTLMARKQRGTEEPLDEGERGESKGGLKFNIQISKI